MPTLKHVRSGDPLIIPASTFNTFVDAARDLQQRQRDRSRDAERDFRQSGIILVRNDSGQDRERFRQWKRQRIGQWQRKQWFVQRLGNLRDGVLK